MGICPEGTYSLETDKSCLPCHSQCGSCRNNSENSCVSCKPGMFLIHDTMTCAASCPANYYTGKEINGIEIRIVLFFSIRSKSSKMYTL